MLDQRQRGEEPDFERVHGALRRLLPRATRRTSTSCSSIWPQQMAAMQAMLNSMTPEQRAQLQGLAEPLLEDMDLRWQMDQLRPEPAASLFPQMGWDRSYDFSGQDPLGFAEAAPDDEPAGRHRPAREPAADGHQPRRPGRGRPRSGPRAPGRRRRPSRSTSCPSWPACSRRPASSSNKEGRFELTPRGMRRIGQNALSRPVPQADHATRWAATSSSAPASATSATYETKPYEFGDPFNLAHRAHGAQRHPPRRRRAPRCG